LTRNHHSDPAHHVCGIDGETFSDLFDRFWDSTVSQIHTDQQVVVIERELRLASGDPVLVLPAGAGRLALALAARGYAVLGMDCSPHAVESCAMLAGRAGSTAEFRCADLDDPSQYRVAAAVCIGWPGAPGQLMNWLALALTAGGRALIDIGATESWNGWTGALDDAGFMPLGDCADLWDPDGRQARRAIVAVRS
jgi:SAM-dependent methyltransferase